MYSFNIWSEKGDNQYYQLLEAAGVHIFMNKTGLNLNPEEMLQRGFYPYVVRTHKQAASLKILSKYFVSTRLPSSSLPLTAVVTEIKSKHFSKVQMLKPINALLDYEINFFVVVVSHDNINFNNIISKYTKFCSWPFVMSETALRHHSAVLNRM